MVDQSNPMKLTHYHPASSDNTACGIPMSKDPKVDEDRDKVNCDECKPSIPKTNEEMVEQNINR